MLRTPAQENVHDAEARERPIVEGRGLWLGTAEAVLGEEEKACQTPSERC